MRQVKIFRKRWQSFSTVQRRMFCLRMLASLLSVVVALGIIFNLRSNILGETGASLATYFFGTLCVLSSNVLIFAGKVRSPESLALKLAIATVIFASAWVNIEEKVALPVIASTCTRHNCEIIYDRHIPFSDAILIYRDGRGWDVLD